MKLASLVTLLQPKYLYGDISNIDIVRLTDDSRSLYPDTIKQNIFIALEGHKTNGLNYIENAYNEGIRIFLIDLNQYEQAEKFIDKLKGAIFLFVTNLSEKVPQITLAVYGILTDKFKHTIGVTGTNGKTTTTKILQWLYLNSGNNVGLIGTINYQYGKKGDITTLKAPNTTPNIIALYNLMLDMLNNGSDILIMEVSSHALALERIYGMCYDAFVFTNLTQDHLDFHKTMDEYLNSKLKIVSYLKPKGIGIINADDKAGISFIKALKKNKKKALSYGLDKSKKPNYFIKKYQLSPNGVSAALTFGFRELQISTNLLGLFNLYNLIGAITGALALGYNEKSLLSAIQNIPQVKGRMDTIRFRDKYGEKLIVVDYAHTPDGLEKVLTNCKEFTTNRLISVFGCGGDRDNTKRPIMGEISARLANMTYITSDNPRTEDPQSIVDQIERGFTSNNPKNKKHHKILDRHEAIKHAILMMQAGDVLVIAGKGHEDYQIFADRTIHFDDGEVAREVITTITGAQIIE